MACAHNESHVKWELAGDREMKCHGSITRETKKWWKATDLPAKKTTILCKLCEDANKQKSAIESQTRERTKI
eukprot:SAG31_NODE_19_length_35031_cov_42.510707_21_plen_72_part_00